MKELPIHIQLQFHSGKTLYEQIYEYIREEIQAGRLLQNEKLPSARFLSEYLQVSRTTVDMAYGQLAAEGYVEARPKKGYFVCAAEELYRIETKPETSGNMPAAETQARQRIAAQADEPVCGIDFSPTAIDMRFFPYATWKKITKNILVDANSRMFSLGEPQGDLELRRTICRYLHGSRGVNCEPEQVIIGAGNDFLLLLLEKILGRHVPIAMENPTYVRAYKMFRSFAYPISLIPMDENGMDVEWLRKTDAQAVYVMPSRQYPTGISMPIGRRMELLKWASEGENRYLIEDDYDSEFRYKGRPLPSLQASDTGGRVVYMGTFSKAIAPAIRISYMVLPYPLLERYQAECGFYASSVSRIDQAVLNEFIRDGYFERYLNKMRKYYRTKHDLLLKRLTPLTNAFQISGDSAGLHILLTDKWGRSEEELYRLASDAGVKVYCMGDFYVEADTDEGKCTQKEGVSFTEENQREMAAAMILGYGALSPEEIEQGAGRLEKVWA